MTREFQPIADKKEIIMQATHTDQDLFITSDKQCLDRIVGNLISNALKFSKPGKKVLIRTAKRSDQTVHIEIQDEIGGFSREDEKTLFSKFKRYKAQPTANESSTGLGLFVAKAMAERMGGTITCQTIETIGSTFTVNLPVKID
jgi:signal transduction histidine kinase